MTVELRQSVSFLIRVGGNVTLLKDLGFAIEKQGNIVWLWPSTKRDDAPVALRLVKVKQAVKGPRRWRRSRKSNGCKSVRGIYLVTNVLDEKDLSDAVCGHLYQRRWGVEVFYRSFKRTLDHHKLRSRAPDQAKEELHWAMLGYLLLGLMGVDALVSRGRDPAGFSVAAGLRIVRAAMRTSKRWRRGGDLRVLFREAIKDTYRRRGSKTARDWPHKKRESPPGAPKIRIATPEETLCAKRIYHAA